MDSPPRLIGSTERYNLVNYGRNFFGVPKSLGPLDLTRDNVSERPGVVVDESLMVVERRVELEEVLGGAPFRLTPMLQIPVSVAYWGANHPAYGPWFSQRYDGCEIKPGPSTVAADSRTLSSLDYALQSFRQKMRHLADPWHLEEFIKALDLLSQLTVANTPGVQFFQGLPLTLGARPWVVQVEQLQTLFLPFIDVADSIEFDRSHPYYALTRELLLSPMCLALLVNIRATAESLPVLFDAPQLANKIFYCPFSMTPSTARGLKTGNRFLFTTSWHQHDFSFYARGGIEAVNAFLALSERHKGLELTIRCKLPQSLDPELRARIEAADNIHVVAEKMPDEAMDQILADADYYLLPATSLHSISTLRAMANGCICVLADSWGSDEYMHHGENGLRLAGREGVSWWYNPATGWLGQSYKDLPTCNMALVRAMIAAIEPLLNDPEARLRLSSNARRYVEETSSVERGRERFGRFLDAICGRVIEGVSGRQAATAR